MIQNIDELFKEIMLLDNDEDKRQALRVACQDLFFLSEAILRNEDSETVGLDREYHGEMAEWLSTEADRKMMLASRGTLKSTMGTRNKVVHEIIKNPNITILIVSATLDNAKKKLRSIAEVFEKNELFRWIFPELIPASFGERWTQTAITVPRKSTAAEGTVEVQGYESELTSRHYDLIIDDDVVGKENSTNREQINKVKNYYTQSLQLLKKPHGRRLIIGTLWNYMDLYNHILENLYEEYDFYIRSCWKHERYLKGSDGKWRWVTVSDKIESVYPALMPVEKILQIKKELEADPLQGLSTFKAQYEMRIVDEKNAIFPRKTYVDQKPVFKESDMAEIKLAFSLSCDPAVSEAKEADEAAFVLRAVDDKGIWYVWDVCGKRGMREEDIIDKYIWYLRTYPIDLATIETVSFQKNIQYALEKRCREENVFFPYYKLPAGYNSANKNQSDLKIRGLSALYATGKIKFRVGEDGRLDREQEELLDQLWRFPKAAHDDRADALAMHLHLPIFGSVVYIHKEDFDAEKKELQPVGRYGQKINSNVRPGKYA